MVIPSDIKVSSLLYAVLHVDACWVGNDVQLGLSCRSINGKLYFAKSCLLNPIALSPTNIVPKKGDMSFAELSAVSYGVMNGIEHNLRLFDVITDSQLAKGFLTNNFENTYSRPEHEFLSVSVKCLWFYSSPYGFGNISWIPGKKNYVADLLSRSKHNLLRGGNWRGGKAPVFWQMIKSDMRSFKGTSIIILGTGAAVTKGFRYDLVEKVFLILIQEAQQAASADK